MSTNWNLLNQNNKKIYGGGNVKQGLVPSGTKFFGMRLKTNLNRAKNGADACKAYDGVCFEQFDRSTVCFGNLSVSLTGGTETTKGGYKYHTFSVAGTYRLEYSQIGVCVTSGPPPLQIDYIIVGGGGGGGGNTNGTAQLLAGGGGGGGAVEGTVTITGGTYSIVVGGGGVGVDRNAGTDGVSSTFSGVTATGGIGAIVTPVGPNAASAGGASGTPSSAGAAVANVGGEGTYQSGPPIIESGGGGGGAGGPGNENTGPDATTEGADGGIGHAIVSGPWNPVVGSAVVPKFGFGGGGAGSSAGGSGGGGAEINGAGAPGTPVGAAGNNGYAASDWSVGTFYAGGGGGGAYTNASGVNTRGGNGASGIVIIRYAV